MRLIVPVRLATSIALCAVFPIQAAQPLCLTTELESELIDSSLALSVGQCHLEAAAAAPTQALTHTQYAYSWFTQAEHLQPGSAVGKLKQVRQKLDEMQHQSRTAALTAQISGH